MVSTVEVPVSLPCTRLPTLTRWRLTRPVIGASTWVNSTLSCAAFSAPSATRLGGVRRLQGLTALVDDLFGDRAGLDQVQAAIELALGKFDLGARIRKLAVGLLGDGLERAGIDDVEQIAGMDHVAVLELDAGDEAADPGADLDLLDRLEPAGELVPIGDGALDRLRDRHRRRRGGRLRRRLFAAARQRDRQQHTDRCAAASRKATKRTAIESGRRSRMLRSVSRTHFRLSKDLECCN